MALGRVVAVTAGWALLAAACGGGTTDEVATDPLGAETSAETSTTNLPVMTTLASTDTTTRPVDPTITELAAALTELRTFIDENGAMVERAGGGSLLASGAFADELADEDLPQVTFDIRAIVDGDGFLWIVVLGDMAAASEAWYEFDAVAMDGRTVVQEVSLIGTRGGPPWVETTPKGFTIDIGQPPTAAVPQTLRGTETEIELIADGFVVYTGIEATDDWWHISFWTYWDLFEAEELENIDPEAAYLYNHFSFNLAELEPFEGSKLKEIIFRYADLYRQAQGLSPLIGGAPRTDQTTEQVIWLLAAELQEAMERHPEYFYPLFPPEDR